MEDQESNHTVPSGWEKNKWEAKNGEKKIQKKIEKNY